MSRYLALVLCLTLPLAGGCGGTPRATAYPISGEVTIAGTPVKQGRITFRPADDPRDAEEGDIVDGKYAFKVSAGPKKVEILSYEAKGPEFEGKPGLIQVLDPKYNTESQNTVTIEAVKDGKYDFKLD